MTMRIQKPSKRTQTHLQKLHILQHIGPPTTRMEPATMAQRWHTKSSQERCFAVRTVSYAPLLRASTGMESQPEVLELSSKEGWGSMSRALAWVALCCI
jgi:hypothetical protein